MTEQKSRKYIVTAYKLVETGDRTVIGSYNRKDAEDIYKEAAGLDETVLVVAERLNDSETKLSELPTPLSGKTVQVKINRHDPKRLLVK